jgi:hypothetical protein
VGVARFFVLKKKDKKQRKYYEEVILYVDIIYLLKTLELEVQWRPKELL